MANPRGHWLWVLLGTRFRITIRGLSGFRITPGLLVTAQPSIVPVIRSFHFLLCFTLVSIFLAA